jgi:thymidylate synthase
VYLPVPPQPDCAKAWLEAAQRVDAQPGHEAHNVLIDVANPMAGATLANPIVARVNDFLMAREKSIECIANTIFPQALYERHGSDKFIEVFQKRVLPKVRKNGPWSGYYFERLTGPSTVTGDTLGQLSRMIDRMRDKSNTSLNKYEISLFDPQRDVTGSPYGGQCLSFLSFHLITGTPRTVLLTAQYRNHYYVEKLLGNLMGLGRLMAFVAAETGTKVGALTVLSTHAQIDRPNATRQQITTLLEQCALPAGPVEIVA